MKKYIQIFSSMKLTVVLLFLTGIFAAVATFIENDYGHETARAFIYDATWFHLILFILGVNLIASIFRYRMWQKEKWTILLFHVSFIVILLGAGITHFLGYEGVMHIREGDSANQMLSDDPYLEVQVEAAGKMIDRRWGMVFSPLTSNRFEKEIDVEGKRVTVRYRDYYGRAAEQVAESPEGKPFLDLKVSEGMNPRDLSLMEGEKVQIGAMTLSFDPATKNDPSVVQFEKRGDAIFLRSPYAVSTMAMADQSKGGFGAGVFGPFTTGHLYRTGSLNIVAKQVLSSAIKRLVPVKMKTDLSALLVDVAYGGATKTLSLQYVKNQPGDYRTADFGGVRVSVRYGSVPITLPFSIKLDDFVLERYPGSMSPSSYESHVVVIDPSMGLKEPYRIYMNHILEHRGFRFYQSSYDPDEMGTVLQVAHDPGKIPTYIGYILMSIGFLLAPFSGKSRFRRLGKMVDRDRERIRGPKVSASSSLLLFLFLFAFVPSLKAAPSDGLPPDLRGIDAGHAERFGRLLVQDVQGRIKPMDSLSMEIVSKLSRNRSMFGLSYNQIVLGMLSNPDAWQNVKLIKLGHPGINLLLGIGQNETYGSFADFFDYSSKQPYRLLESVENAQRRDPASRSRLDKDLIKVDELANVSFMVFRGDMFKVFPLAGDPGYHWHSVEDMKEGFDPATAAKLTELWTGYLQAVRVATIGGDWTKADALLDELKSYQRTSGGKVVSSGSVVEAEILFNHLNIFDNLTLVYLLLGFVLLGLTFAKVAKTGLNTALPMRIASVVLFIAFVAQTFGLALRWYVSGHAPWSNGYESLVYIVWATVLAGFLFARHSPFSLAATSIIAGMGLFVAHLSWMDPQITNLVPVLKSYWLTIHVSVISASYGFLALGALLGFFSLILFIFRSEKHPQIDYSIRELVRIDEMTLMIGLALLSIGNILGAVWANESWGRYWSWDPKETWTFISMVVYAAILHFRFIPALNSFFSFAVGSVVAYAVVLMTYFGVNYYLTGLHSYGAGDPVPIPVFVYYTVAVLTLVIFLARRKRDRIDPLKDPGA